MNPISLSRSIGCAALVLMIAGCNGGSRPESRHSDNQTIFRGTDVLATGDTPQVADSAAGDVIMAGGTLHFSGSTAQDDLGAGGEQRISGRIHGALRAAGGDIRVSGAVGRNATIAGGKIEIDRSASIAQNAYLAGGGILVEGTIGTGLYIAGGDVMIDGVVNGNVEVSSGTLRLGPNTRIAGNLTTRVPAKSVRIDPAAQIVGQRISKPASDWSGLAKFGITLIVIWYVGYLIAGAVITGAFAGFTQRTADTLHASFGMSLLRGLGWVIGVPIAIVIACITVVGIPLGIIAMLLYMVALYVASMFFAAWFGRLVLRKTGMHQSRWGVVMAFLVGALLMWLVTWIPVVGWIAGLIVLFAGFGAMTSTLYAQLRSRPPGAFTHHATAPDTFPETLE